MPRPAPAADAATASYRGRWFDYLLVSPDEMRALAESGGWKLERVLEDDDGDDYYVGILRKG